MTNPLSSEEMQRLAALLPQHQPGQQGGSPAAPPPMIPVAGATPEASTAAGSSGLQAGGAGAAAAAATNGGGDSSVFISWQERKHSSHHTTKPSKKAGGGHAYVVQFYLVDASGGEHLAVVGEDQGDAHYLYTNQAPFPFLHCHNKQDVVAWLEDILATSKLRAGMQSEVVLDREPSDTGAVRLPTFVAYRHEKDELEDGRHRMRWYLIDKMAHEHLAVYGEEKETRDGHYTYSTVGVFHDVRPLECGNQHEVNRWLDSMVVPHHHEGPRGGGAGKAAARGADSGGGAPALSGGGPVRSDTTGGGSRGALSGGGVSRHRAAGSKAGAGKKAGTGHKRGGDDLLRHATTNLKRKSQAVAAGGATAPRPGAPPPGAFESPAYRAALFDAEGREAVVGELKKWAQEEAVKREATKRAALGFLADLPKEGEAAALKRSLDVLTRASQAPQSLPRKAKSATHPQLLSLIEVVAALRQMAHAYLPLRVLASPGLGQALGELKKHQNPEVAGLAAGILDQALRVAVTHAQVLADEKYVTDPRKTLAASLEDPQELDRLVAEITRQAQRRQGGLLDDPLLAATAAAAAAGGPTRSGGAPLAGDGATPGGGGISATPSELSLALLEGEGGAGDFARTVERRRLDLSELGETPGAAPAGHDSPAAAAAAAAHGQPMGLPPLPPHHPHHAHAGRPASPFVCLPAAGEQQGGGPGRVAARMEEAPSQALVETPMPMELDAQLL